MNNVTLLEKKRNSNVIDLTLRKNKNNINANDDYIELENSDSENEEEVKRSRIIDPFAKINGLKSKNKSDKINNASTMVNKFFKSNN